MRSERTNQREFRLYRLAKALGRVSPFWFLQSVGAVLGVVFLLVSSRRRTVSREPEARLSRSFRVLPVRPRCALRRTLRANRVRLHQMGAGAGRTLSSMVTCRGLENLEEARARGKGVFLLSAHFGHWEVAAQWLAVHGFPQALVYRPLENPLMEAELAASRTRFGSSLIPKAGATRGIMKTLKGGGIVDILIDQKADLEHSVIVDFLGIPTPTTPLLATFVLATGAAVTPLFSYPRGVGYKFTIEPCILGRAGRHHHHPDAEVQRRPLAGDPRPAGALVLVPRPLDAP